MDWKLGVEGSVGDWKLDPQTRPRSSHSTEKWAEAPRGRLCASVFPELGIDDEKIPRHF